MSILSILKNDPSVFQGGTLPHRCCVILVQAADVTDGGAGLWGACDGTPQDAMGVWASAASTPNAFGAVTSCAGSLKAVAAMPFLFNRSNAALDSASNAQA